ncbi:MAG: hypothetical protein ACREQY_06860 [Candidatus Binatia bacterium]
MSMRVLLSDIGNASSGDEALAIAATRRLQAIGCEVTWLYRVNQDEAFRKAGVRVPQVPMPVEETFSEVRSLDDLAAAFADRSPELEGEGLPRLRRSRPRLRAPPF